ncbi:MAG TPA: PspC domain-containing protein [Pedobacter sp.]|jgi:phage shock protein PspC (stress-responsive transcriptional regulator)
MEKKLERNEQNKMIAGVASGLADYLELDMTLVRVLFILAFIFGLSGLLIYIVMWVAVPKQSVFQASAFETDYILREEPLLAAKKKDNSGRLIPGLILICIGLYFLLAEFHILPHWFSIFKLWPVILIIAGITILIRSRAKQSPINYNAPIPPLTKDNNLDNQPLA